jgi:phosphate transport system substrate-binding protein
MPYRKNFVVFAAATGLACLTACNSSSSTVNLNGAGSTFVNPLMGRWIQDFQQSHTNVRINYQSIGSGGGIQQVKSGTIDFGASDAPLSDQDLAQMTPVIQIPESAGPVCVTYNLDGLDKPLQLSSDVLAGIFLGKITSWQDPLVKKDNPQENLPNAKITVVHRAERAAAPLLPSLRIFPRSTRIGHSRSAKAQRLSGQRESEPKAVRELPVR